MGKGAIFGTGLIIGFVITMSYVGYQLGLKRDPCELNLPRTEKCVMLYVPESVIEEVKQQ